MPEPRTAPEHRHVVPRGEINREALPAVRHRRRAIGFTTLRRLRPDLRLRRVPELRARPGPQPPRGLRRPLRPCLLRGGRPRPPRGLLPRDEGARGPPPPGAGGGPGVG